MISANELRIGNLYIGFYNKICTMCDSDFISEEFKLAEPIPLTEEWQPKLGYNAENGYTIDLGRKAVTLAESEGDYVILYRCDIGHEFYLIGYVENVHNVQNLFFALTNEELKLKA